MANRDAKLIKRTIQDFSLNAGSGNGGVVTVSELPKVGQEDTIYALEEKEIVPSSYNWAVVPVDSTLNTSVISTDAIMVADSRETLDIDLVKAKLNAGADNVIVYYRATDDVDWIRWGEVESSLSISSVERQTEQGTMIGFFTGNFTPFCVVTEYSEDLNLEIESLTQTVKFPDGSTKVYTEPGDVSYNVTGFVQLIDTTDKLEVYNNKVSKIYEITKLPTAKEVIANHYNKLTGDSKRNFLILDNGEYKETIYKNASKILGYYFDTEEQNFYADDERPILYEGELEWESQDAEMTDVLYFATSDSNTPFIFTPTPDGVVTKTTKYVYENGEYINISEPSISANRFTELKDVYGSKFENIYFGDKLEGTKVKYDYQVYYEKLLENHQEIIPYNAQPGWFNYRNDNIINFVFLEDDGTKNGEITVFLKYDYEGNVWAYFTFNKGWDWHSPYTEISAAIQVATAEDMQNPEFVFPIVEYEIPSGIEYLSDAVFDNQYYFGTEALIKIYKD